MDAATLATGLPSLQRATGELMVSVKRRNLASVLDVLRQAGCLKARFPRPVTDGWMDAVMLNTSGGVAGGDRLDSSFDIQIGARVTISAQAAERFYRASAGSAPSRVRTRVAVAAGAAAEWLPQETILFDRCAMDRRLDVELADDAWFLAVESLVFGRAAMGERVGQAWVRDSIRVRRGGRLVLHDAIRLDGDVDAVLQRRAIADGARAVATMVQVGPGAEAALEGVRAALADASVDGGASAWNGMLLTRILAADGATLRAAVIALLTVLRAGRPLPRVWQC